MDHEAPDLQARSMRWWSDYQEEPRRGGVLGQVSKRLWGTDSIQGRLDGQVICQLVRLVTMGWHCPGAALLKEVWLGAEVSLWWAEK
jgi:hypothetical protein